MHRKPDATGSESRADAGSAPDPFRLVALLREGDIDAAIEAGLMAFVDDGRCDLDAATRELLADAQRRLRIAWGARERHRARAARLARRQAERDARRAKPPAQVAAKPALPAAAAAALARARTRARQA